MLSQENLEQILKLALKTGADFADLFIEESTSTILSCEDNKIEKISSGTQVGAGLRLIKGKETFYAASSDISLSGLLNQADTLSRAINASVKKMSIELTPHVEVKHLLKNIRIRPNDVSLQEKANKTERLNKTARLVSPHIKQVSINYADTNQSVTIANSLGKYIEDNRIRTRYFINVIAEKNGVLQTALEAPGGTVGFELFEHFPPEKVAMECAERAVMMLDAAHAPSGKMMVVLSSTAGGTLIHEACGHALEADFIMKGTSVFAGKLEQKVANDIITVIDNATLPGRFGSFAFDDEGTPSHKTILIENGILTSYLADYYSSEYCGIKPTGNARRESFRTKPQPRMTNTMIAPGNSDPQEIIESVKNGLFVKHMGGGQVDVTSGDFVFEVREGYLIENGKIKSPVRGAILIGNGPEILKSIDMVGSDLGFQTGVCGKYDHVPVSTAQPTIRIPNVIVGGR